MGFTKRAHKQYITKKHPEPIKVVNIAASMFALDAGIQGNIGWHLQGNWSSRNQSEAIFDPGGSFESTPWAPVALCQTSDALGPPITGVCKAPYGHPV